MTKLSEYETLALNKLGETIHHGKWSEQGLVQLIELAGDYLNMQTIPDYAVRNNLTYNGVKKTRTITTLFNVKFVTDNA